MTATEHLAGRLPIVGEQSHEEVTTPKVVAKSTSIAGTSIHKRSTLPTTITAVTTTSVAATKTPSRAPTPSRSVRGARLCGRCGRTGVATTGAGDRRVARAGAARRVGRWPTDAGRGEVARRLRIEERAPQPTGMGWTATTAPPPSIFTIVLCKLAGSPARLGRPSPPIRLAETPRSPRRARARWPRWRGGWWGARPR